MKTKMKISYPLLLYAGLFLLVKDAMEPRVGLGALQLVSLVFLQDLGLIRPPPKVPLQVPFAQQPHGLNFKDLDLLYTSRRRPAESGGSSNKEEKGEECGMITQSCSRFSWMS